MLMVQFLFPTILLIIKVKLYLSKAVVSILQGYILTLNQCQGANFFA